MSWIGNIVDTVLGILTAPIESLFMEIFDMTFLLISTGTANIFYDSTVLGILKIVSEFSFVVLVFSIPFLLKDLYMQADNIDVRQVIDVVFKGYLFSKVSIIGGISFFRYSFYILSLVGLNIDNTQIQQGFLPAFGTFKGALIIIVIVIATVVFLIEMLKTTSSMLIHLLATPIYVPYIIKGDTQKLSEWISTAVSIAVTYFIQYFVFYMAVWFAIQSRYMLALIFLTAAFTTKNALKGFAYTTGGSRGILGVSQSALYALRGIRGLM